MKRAFLTLLLTLAFATSAVAATFNVGVVNPTETRNATYPGTSGGILDNFNWVLGS